MKRFPQFLRKYHWYLLPMIVLPVCLLMLFGWHMSEFGNALAAKNYVEYIKYFYLPEQKRRTGQWPANLEGLTQENPANHEGMVDEVLRSHRNLFERFEVIKNDRKSCTFVLHLHNYDVKCTSYLTEKENDDESCIYTEK